MKGTCTRRGNRWRARVKLDGEWQSETFDTKTMGERWLATVIAEHSKGSPLDHLRKGKTPFRELAEGWRDDQEDEVSKRTFINIKGRVDNYIVPAFGSMRIADIRENHVRTWRRDMSSKGLANETVNKIVEHLNAILDAAHYDGTITRNPAARLRKLPKQPRRPIHPLTPTQVVSLAEAITPRYRGLVLLMANGTGMRPGELWALRPERVNLLTGVVHVLEATSEPSGHIETREPKMNKKRSISLDPEMISILRDHVERFPSPDFIFTTPEGCQVRHNNFLEDHFNPARASLADALPKGFVLYDLRHTHASLLISRGWRSDQVKDRLGHASIRTTIDIYGHLFPDHDREQLLDLAEVTRLALRGEDATKTRPLIALAPEA